MINGVFVIVPATPLRLAKIVTDVLEATGEVLIAKGDEVIAPSTTLTFAGIVAKDGFELERLKTSPPAGAGLARVSLLEVKDKPPCTPVAARLKETATGFTDKIVESVGPVKSAAIVTGVLVDTPVVTMLKFDEVVAPAATWTDAGTEATDGLELVKCTE